MIVTVPFHPVQKLAQKVLNRNTKSKARHINVVKDYDINKKVESEIEEENPDNTIIAPWTREELAKLKLQRSFMSCEIEEREACLASGEFGISNEISFVHSIDYQSSLAMRAICKEDLHGQVARPKENQV